MKNLFVVITLILTSLNTFAQNTLLFEVSGKDLKSPSYIVGTMHMMCPDDFQIKDKVWTALEKVDKLVFEIDYTSPAEMQDMMSLMQSKESLSTKLTTEQKTELIEKLKLYGKTFEEVENLNISSIYMLLIQSAITCKPEQLKMYEVELLKVAMTQQKQFGGLETVKSQFSTLDKTYTVEETIKGLGFKEEYFKVFAQMVNAFKNENLIELDKIIRDKRFMNAEQEHHMLTVRNHKWAEVMPEEMKKTSTLYAVGSGHLAGKNGILNLLKKQGYTIKPIL